MRSFSNIMPNFAANLHLLVDSIDRTACYLIILLFLPFVWRNKNKFISLHRVPSEHRHFICSNLSSELRPRTREKERNQVHIGAAPYSADSFIVYLVVADLDESMAGLHFSYAHKLVLTASK